jgi:hypothetical protein
MTSIDQQHSLAGNAAIAQLLGHRGDVAPAWMARSTFHGRFFDRDGRHHHRRPIVIGWAGPITAIRLAREVEAEQEVARRWVADTDTRASARTEEQIREPDQSVKRLALAAARAAANKD